MWFFHTSTLCNPHLNVAFLAAIPWKSSTTSPWHITYLKHYVTPNHFSTHTYWKNFWHTNVRFPLISGKSKFALVMFVNMIFSWHEHEVNLSCQTKCSLERLAITSSGTEVSKLTAHSSVTLLHTSMTVCSIINSELMPKEISLLLIESYRQLYSTGHPACSPLCSVRISCFFYTIPPCRPVS